MSDELLKLRNEIDRIDEEILARLAERARCAQRVGEIKRGVMYYRPEREAQVLRRLAELNPGPLSADAVKTIFREVMSACLGLEQPLRVAYLGPAGTFSESASRKHFGSAPNFLPMAAIDDVFRAVEAGNADYGVVPVENSTEGAVGGTLDLLLANPLKVCGEVRLRIHQQLMSRAEGIGAARRIYSHSQSLAQCHEWLNRNPAAPAAHSGGEQRRGGADGLRRPGILRHRRRGRRPSFTISTSSRPISRTTPTTPPAFWSSPITTPAPRVRTAPRWCSPRPTVRAPSMACSSHWRATVSTSPSCSLARRAPACGSTCSMPTSKAIARTQPLALRSTSSTSARPS